MSEPVKPTDGKILHFLKELPAWAILYTLMIILIAVNYFAPADFLPRLVDQSFGGLLTALFGIARRATGSNTNITAETVQAESVNPESMDHAVVNADNFNSENKEKN